MILESAQIYRNVQTMCACGCASKSCITFHTYLGVVPLTSFKSSLLFKEACFPVKNTLGSCYKVDVSPVWCFDVFDSGDWRRYVIRDVWSDAYPNHGWVRSTRGSDVNRFYLKACAELCSPHLAPCSVWTCPAQPWISDMSLSCAGVE